MCNNKEKLLYIKPKESLIVGILDEKNIHTSFFYVHHLYRSPKRYETQC